MFKYNYNMKKFIYIKLLFLSSIVGNGCIPAQLIKFHLEESFEQEFEFHNLELGSDSSISKNKFIGSMLQINGLSDSIFSNFIGSQKGFTIRESLYTGKVKTKGNVSISISLNPYNKMEFIVTGGGNYEIFDDSTKQVYFSTTFRILGCNNCSDLKRVYKEKVDGKEIINYLEIEFNQFATNQFYYPEDPNVYIHTPSEPILLKIKLEKYKGKRISIAYGTPQNPVKHDVIFKDKVIGKLIIIPPNDEDLGAKIIGFKGIRFVREQKR